MQFVQAFWQRKMLEEEAVVFQGKGTERPGQVLGDQKDGVL